MMHPQVRARIAEALRDQGRPPAAWPDIPEDLVQFLEHLYPARCLEPNEAVEDHLRYAGAVSLVADMRHHHDMAREIEAAMDMPPGDSVEVAL